MKKTVLISALFGLICASFANSSDTLAAIRPDVDQVRFQPFSVGYQWSLSGKQYATFNYDLRADFLAKGLTLTGVAGYELKTGAQPSMGFGLTTRVNFDPVFMDLGAFVLFPQNGRPDVGLGLQFGVKF